MNAVRCLTIPSFPTCAFRALPPSRRSITADEMPAAADLGITQGHFGPIEHVLQKPYPSFEEKARAIEQFAECVF